MRNTARALLPLAVFFLFTACRSVPPPPPGVRSPGSDPGLATSPRRLVGRVLAVDPARRFVIIDLAAGAPLAALAPDTELLIRTGDLRPTARVRISRHHRGRTLGTILLSGEATVGDEVVFPSPP